MMYDANTIKPIGVLLFWVCLKCPAKFSPITFNHTGLRRYWWPMFYCLFEAPF